VSRSRSALMIIIVSIVGISPAASQPYAYVTNAGSATVSIIDTQTDKVTSTFNVGEKPRGIAASVDGARLYVAHQTGTLIERDVYTDKSARITVGGSAKAIRASPDGKILSIVIGESDVVALIDMATLRVKTVHISGKNAAHAVFSPDGKWIYANAEDGDSVDVIDLAKGTVATSIDVGHAPKGIGFLPDGSRAYVVVGDEMVVIDVPHREVVARLKSTERLSDVAVHPDGKRVFVSAANAASVQVLDVESNRFIANVEVGAGPSNMALTPDGSKLYVACSRSNEVSVIDTSTYKRIQNVPAVAQPYGIVISDPPNLPRDWD
jgi:YVTN family beta-propeller protein